MYLTVIAIPCIWIDVNLNFQRFVSAKRKSSSLPSSVRLNSIEALTDPEIADLFSEFFQSTYSSVSWSNSSHPNHSNKANCIYLPVTRRVKGYTRFVGPHKVFIFLIRVTSRVDLAMSLCPSVRMNAEISETIRATILELGKQIPEIPAQPKFVSAMCHSHSNARKPTKPHDYLSFATFVLSFAISV